MNKNGNQRREILSWPRKMYRGGRLLVLWCLLALTPAPALAVSREHCISLKMENATVQEVFDEITRATGLDFFYNNALFDVARRVSVTLSEASIEEALGAVFTGYRVRFTINDHFIVLLDLQPGGSLQRQGQFVTGVVVDPGGIPLAGVTVRVKGTSAGVASDREGRFSIPVPFGDPPPVLQFSFIGMKTREVAWKGEETLFIKMDEEAKEIEEIVVLGIASVSRRDMVGSFTTLPIDAVMQPAYGSVDQMLEGRVAGMAVTSTSIRAGSAPSIAIRGRSTLLGNTQPLWVVDGVVQSDVMEVDALSGMWNSSSDDNLVQYLGSQISWLNPNDIETVTVLKDATSTAIYGSRASNGVIVITTRKGSADRFSVNASANWSVRARPTYAHYDLMNSQQRIRFSQEAFNAGAFYLTVPIAQPYTYEGLLRLFHDGAISESEFVSQYTLLEAVNTDWLGLLTRNAVGQRYNVSVNGGTSRSTYSLSASYDRAEGVEVGNDSERATARLAVGITLSDRARLEVSLGGGLTKTTGFAAGVNPLGYATATSRAIPARHPDGSLLFYKVADAYLYNESTATTGLDFNILHEIANTGSSFRSPTFNANINFRWEFLPAFAHELVAGVKLDSRKGEIWADAPSEYIARRYRGYTLGAVEPESPYYNAALLPFGGELQTDDTFGQAIELRNTIKYSRTFDSDHRVALQASWETRSNYRNSKVNTVWGFERDRGERISLPANATIVPVGSVSPPKDPGVFSELYSGRWRSTNFTNTYASLILIGSYSLKNKYIFNANARNDWSNRFGQNVNRRFDPTYSLGVAWHVASEPWMRAEALDRLSARLSYGIQGNVLNSVSPEMILLKGNASTLYNGYATSISQLANPHLTWERTRTWNFGLDLGLFRDRFSLVADGYTRYSNVGTAFQLSPEYGGYSTPVTGTYTRNTGVEITLNARLVSTPDWNLAVGGNAAKNWNKIVKTDLLDASPRVTANYINGQDSRVLAPGYAHGTFWAYDFAGLDENGYPTFNRLDMEKGTPFTDFLVRAGVKTPLVNGGANLHASYKGLSLRAHLAFSVGASAFLPDPYEAFYLGHIPSPVSNLPAALARRWKKTGDPEAIPGLYTNRNVPITLADPSINNSTNTEDRYRMWARSNARVAPTSTLKCKSVQLSWNGKPAALARAGVKSIAINATVNNLFLIADKAWNGMDPALGGNRVEPRSFNIGLNIGL